MLSRPCCLILHPSYVLPLFTSSASNKEDNEGEKDLQAIAQDMLLSLPCINSLNFRAVMAAVNSIAELSQLSVAELTPLIGPGNAKKLYFFFRKRQH